MKYFKNTFLVVTSTLLSACAATQAPVEGSSDLSSREVGAKAVAQCNIMNGPEISAKLKANQSGLL